MFESTAMARLQPEEETRLLSRAVADPSAFGQLYQAYVRPVYRYLYYRVGNQMDAEDLTAQVFIRAFEGMGRYRHEGHFLAWLMKIARNRAIDYFRSRRPLVSIEFLESLLVDTIPGSLESEQTDRLRMLAAYINQMEEDEKELLRLRFAASLPFQEIAVLLNSNESTIKKRFYRLLDRMKQALEGALYESR